MDNFAIKIVNYILYGIKALRIDTISIILKCRNLINWNAFLNVSRCAVFVHILKNNNNKQTYVSDDFPIIPLSCKLYVRWIDSILYSKRRKFSSDRCMQCI